METLAVPSAGFVLDSWPILEWMYGKQPATDKFRRLLEEAEFLKTPLYLSRINYGEVLYCAHRQLGHERALARIADFSDLPIRVVSVDDLLVDEAAALKMRYPVSYADAFAAALALRMKVPVVTGDPEFYMLQQQTPLQVIWLGA